MLKLSKRAWNNVLIFSMIGLILILNLENFGEKESTTRLIVPEGVYIISMQINQVEIERAGQVWRIDPNGVQVAAQMTEQRLQSIVQAWQQAYISPADIDFDAALFGNPNSLVVLSLAGQAQPIVVALTIVEQQLFFVIDKQVYVLNSPTIQSLLEPIVNVKL